MARRSKKQVKKRGKVRDVRLNGLFYSVDPSSGGGDSNPAVAIWQGGELVDAFEIPIPKCRSVESRLNYLLHVLLDLPEPDIWAIEHIPPYIHTPGGKTVNFSLHKSVGVFQAVWGKTTCIVIPVQSWKALVSSVPNYTKTDRNDAILIGVTALTEGDVDVDTERVSLFIAEGGPDKDT